MGQTYSGKTFTNERVVLDDNTFERCIFQNCVVTYAGGNPPRMLSNTFEQGTQVTFEGAAANTVAFMKALAGDAGMRAIIRSTFPEVFSH